jgi:hypothetical protein
MRRAAGRASIVTPAFFAQNTQPGAMPRLMEENERQLYQCNSHLLEESYVPPATKTAPFGNMVAV